MPNKLKEVFNDDPPILGKINFKDSSYLKRFQESIQQAFLKGEKVYIEGVESITSELKSGLGTMTLAEQSNPTDFTIEPAKEDIVYPLSVNNEIINLSLRTCMVNNGFLIETTEKAVISTKIIFDTKYHKANIEMHPDPAKAENVEGILKWAEISKRFMESIFLEKDHGVDNGLDNIFERLAAFRELFEDVLYVESKYNIKFNTRNIDLDDRQSLENIYELCLALREKKAIRVAAKLTATESTGFRANDNQEIKIGEPVVVTFTGDSECLVWGEKIRLYCVYMLNNALIKSVTEFDNGEIKVTYGDTDVAPMYYSYKGFIDKDEAEKEQQEIIKHEEEYKNARTIYQNMGDESKENSALYGDDEE